MRSSHASFPTGDLARDIKEKLKDLWSWTVLSGCCGLADCHVRLLNNPYNGNDPIMGALSYLASKNLGLNPAPFILRFSLMPVFELCQLALLWMAAGEVEAATRLIQSIPLDFPWGWCKADEYREEDAKRSALLLRHLIGQTEIGCPSDSDPYFRALSLACGKCSWDGLKSAPLNGPSETGMEVSYCSTDNLRCTLSVAGDQTALGSLSAPCAMIRAFGPQAAPLHDPRGFGIRSLQERGPWVSAAALPEVCLKASFRTARDKIILELSFMGLGSKEPFFFSFYVKAASAEIGGEKVKPRTLHKYLGKPLPILFGGALILESDLPGKLELIPLSGEREFWGCEYLAAFEIPSFDSKAIFSFCFSLK